MESTEDYLSSSSEGEEEEVTNERIANALEAKESAPTGIRPSSAFFQTLSSVFLSSTKL